MEIDSKCYTFKRLEAVEGLFDPSVDATYVITLEGNGRYEKVEGELKKYHPTKVLYIMSNRGYKRCNKNLKQNLPRYDLTDAFINVFRHANQQGYKNVLILEDDFIFSDRVFDPAVQANVNGFISARTDTNFIYLLGCLPQLQLPYDRYHNIPLFSGGMHAVVYSRLSREMALHDYQTTTIDDWDIYYNWRLNRYTYYEPLVYQIYPMTENRKNWACWDITLYLADLTFKYYRLDRDPEPGHSIFYARSKAAFYFYILAAIVVVWFLFFYAPYTKVAAKTIKYIRKLSGRFTR